MPAALIKKLFHRHNIHPRRWLNSFLAYPRYLGYIRPQLSGCDETEFRIRRAMLAQSWDYRQIEVPCGKKILALSPHPDDESFGAGGFLWAHRDVCEIHLAAVTNGEKGGADASGKGEGLAEIRKKEFLTVAQKLRAKSCSFFDYPDSLIPCTQEAAMQLRDFVEKLRPDTVILPWFLDNHLDHRLTNILYAWGCMELDINVFAYETWSLLEPNAVLDISAHLEEKTALIQSYASQLRTVDYLNYSASLAKVRAFHYPVTANRNGAVEAYLALPNHEYCGLVRQLYGQPYQIRKDIESLPAHISARSASKRT